MIVSTPPPLPLAPSRKDCVVNGQRTKANNKRVRPPLLSPPTVLYTPGIPLGNGLEPPIRFITRFRVSILGDTLGDSLHLFQQLPGVQREQGVVSLAQQHLHAISPPPAWPRHPPPNSVRRCENLFPNSTKNDRRKTERNTS